MPWRSLATGRPRVPRIINNSSLVFVCVLLSIGRSEYNVLRLSGSVFLSLLIDEMEGKKREHEEN